MYERVKRRLFSWEVKLRRKRFVYFSVLTESLFLWKTSNASLTCATAQTFTADGGDSSDSENPDDAAVTFTAVQSEAGGRNPRSFSHC